MAKHPQFEIIALHPQHILTMKPRAMERTVFDGVGDLEAFAQRLAAPGMAYAALDGDEVVGCAGIMPMHPGVGEAWSLLSERLQPGKPDRAWAAVRRAMRRGIDAAFDVGYHRIQATISVKFPSADAWMRGLGLTPDGGSDGGGAHLMAQYGTDRSDHWMYSRTRDKE